jgi:AcrR family transcriptional regulator
MTAPTPHRPRAQKPSKNRDKLVQAASQLMAAQGFAATGTEDIVRAAGITRGALYYQFEDKGDLFRAVCEDQIRRIAMRLSDETMERASCGEEELEIGSQLLLDYFAEPAICRILLVDGPAVLGTEAWRALLQPVVLGLLSHGLEHLVEVGQLDPIQVDPLAHLLFGSITQAGLAIGSADDPKQAREVYSRAISELLTGIGRAR